MSLPSIAYRTVVERVKHILQREQIAIYIYEIGHIESLLQRRLGLNFGLSNDQWRILYYAIKELVQRGELIIYRDPIEGCLAVVAKSRWVKDIRADPKMGDLQVLNLLEIEDELLMSLIHVPNNNRKESEL